MENRECNAAMICNKHFTMHQRVIVIYPMIYFSLDLIWGKHLQFEEEKNIPIPTPCNNKKLLYAFPN